MRSTTLKSLVAAAVLTIGTIGSVAAAPLSTCIINTAGHVECDLYEEDASGATSELGWDVPIPAPVGSGVVLILEAGGNAADLSTWSDMLIFGDGSAGGVTQIVRLVSDGCGTGNEGDLSCFLTRIDATIFEDASGLATFVAGDGNTYRVHSDGDVPEPATLALVGIALAGLGVSRRRRS